MKELHIELSDIQFEYLTSIGKRKGLSPEQLLIDIFETLYPFPSTNTEEKLQILRKARGIWEEREDISK